MRHSREREVLDSLRGFVQEIISEAIASGISSEDVKPQARAHRSGRGGRLSPMQERIVSCLGRGRKTSYEVAERIGSTPSSVRVQMARLARVGTLRRVARGVYEVAR